MLTIAGLILNQETDFSLIVSVSVARSVAAIRSDESHVEAPAIIGSSVG
jgi:hypothetical protein